ncbi:hypothetical protein Tco_1062643 [Tanacetum coccineum]
MVSSSPSLLPYAPLTFNFETPQKLTDIKPKPSQLDNPKTTNTVALDTTVIIIESNTNSDDNPFRVTSDDNPFQFSSDESYGENPLQVNINDTLMSSSGVTCSSDDTWEQKKQLKVNEGQALQLFKLKKAIISPELLKWYDDLSSDE